MVSVSLRSRQVHWSMQVYISVCISTLYQLRFNSSSWTLWNSSSLLFRSLRVFIHPPALLLTSKAPHSSPWENAKTILIFNTIPLHPPPLFSSPTCIVSQHISKTPLSPPSGNVQRTSISNPIPPLCSCVSSHAQHRFSTHIQNIIFTFRKWPEAP